MVEVNGSYQSKPEERPAFFSHSLITTGVMEHPDGYRIIVVRGLAGPSRYEVWFTPEKARLFAQSIIDRANDIEQGAELHYGPINTDTH